MTPLCGAGRAQIQGAWIQGRDARAKPLPLTRKPFAEEVLEVGAVPGYVLRPSVPPSLVSPMSQTSSEQNSSRPPHHTVATVLGGIGLFVLGAVVGTVSLHFWMAGHDFRRTVTTAEFIQDWQLSCPPAKQTADACSARQVILQQGTNAPLAQIEVDHGVNADVIKFVVPLGVFVGPGLAFAADGNKPVQIPYTTCDYSGCIAVAPLTATQLDQMEHGTSGRVVVLARNGKAAAIPYSLKGFAEAIRERDSDWRMRAGHWF